MSDLTIIILTYNSQGIILDSLQKLDCEKYKIVVVDNASSDDTMKLIKENFPQITVIQNQKNLGFGRANNIALRKVETDFALILNPDAFISCQDIEKIILVLQKNPQIALAAPLLYNCSYDRKNKKISNEKVCEIAQKNLLKDCGEFFSSKFITAACMFVNMNILRKIGFFDENFFMYCEDNELNKRVKKSGFEIATIKETKFLHLGGESSSSSKKNDASAYFIEWHRLGWSKIYYTKAIHGNFVGSLKALRKIITLLPKIFFTFIKGEKINLRDKAALSGSFACLIGLQAFDKNDNPRRGLFG